MEAPPFDVEAMLGKEFGDRADWKEVLREADQLAHELDDNSVLVRTVVSLFIFANSGARQAVYQNNATSLLYVSGCTAGGVDCKIKVHFNIAATFESSVVAEPNPTTARIKRQLACLFVSFLPILASHHAAFVR